MEHRVLSSLGHIIVWLLLMDYISSQCQPTLENNVTSRRELLNGLLNNTSYDARVPPDYEKSVPTNVSVKIHLLSFDSVRETQMDYSVEMFLTQEWNDERLKFSNATNSKWLEVDSKMMPSVWVPDIYFRNEKEASFHEITVPNKYMHLYPEGRVVYSMRLSLTLHCRMNLAKYPLDSQKCPMRLQSYTYTTENVMFFWDKLRPIKFDDDMNWQMELPQFTIVGNMTSACSINSTDSSEPTFACIIAYFILQRDIRYFIIQVYVPSILIVILSWVSFWLDLEAVPARVSLGVLTALTLNTHGSTVHANLPKVSYIKAIDVWVVTSLIFVFAALLEFAYVNVLARRASKVVGMAQASCLLQDAMTDISSDFSMNGDRFPVGFKTSNYKLLARQVDKISRVVFPLSFVTFNIVYWIVYIYIDM